jgi:nicotinamide phosphoribosyltransferase
MLCTEFKDHIISSGAKVVFRPDSGDMMEVVPRLLEMQAKAFGFVVNEKGYKKINNVGVLQGDGVDHMTIKSLLGRVLAMGFSADNVVFGSGGSLLQKVNRDTYKFAQKASAILKNVWVEDGDLGSRWEKQWIGIAKNPVTDPGKQSKQGRLTLVRSKVNGEYMTVDVDKPLDVEFEEVMRTIWDGTQLLVEDTLEQVRARCAL